MIAVAVPWLAQVLHAEMPGRESWLLIAGMSLVPAIAGQMLIALSSRWSRGVRATLQKKPSAAPM